MTHLEPVWITGIGATTPLGDSFDAIAESLLACRSATRKILEHQGNGPVECIATQVDAVPVPADFDPGTFAAMPKFEQMALWSAAAALGDAQLWDKRQGLRVGIVLGLAGEWYRRWQADWAQQGSQIYEPIGDRRSLVHFTQEQLGLAAGPTASVGAACASANWALALGRRWVSQGLVDICLAGSSEIACPITRSNFNNLRALSRRMDDPEHAARPFDRDGFVMGEGAAIFVLESQSSARRRGARAYAEVAGFGASSDASHMIIPSDDPEPAAISMRAALASAGVEARDVDYVNAHATGTVVGDRAEARAIRLVLGSRTELTPVTSTKSMTGHLVSAAAAIEAIACIAAIQQQAIPPTANLDHPDPECNLCHVPNQAVAHRVQVAISNSFGFGGNNTTLLLRKAG
jgi:3-oxoacyl-[acyl-carrier-protein] synthase II